MSQFTRTNGDLQPQLNFDTNAYTVGAVNAFTSGATVNPQGPKLDFSTITFTGNGAATPADVNAAIVTLQQSGTVAMFRMTTVSANADTLAVAMYPTGAWAFGAASANTALTTGVGYTCTTTTSATFG